MGHLVTNLQIYLQLDVIDTNFSRLQQAIAHAQVRDRGCGCVAPTQALLCSRMTCTVAQLDAGGIQECSIRMPARLLAAVSCDDLTPMHTVWFHHVCTGCLSLLPARMVTPD
jgi:hypothetical protein